MKTLALSFAPSGKAVAIYDDALLDTIDALGSSKKRRASHVEPDGDLWTVDMTPASGPARLGAYRKRADALAAEVEWLREHLTSCA